MASPGTHRKASFGDVLDEHEACESLGGLVDTRRLAEMLAYPSANALRHAHRRGRLPVPLFHIAGRKGLFARLSDVEILLREGLQQAHPPAPNGASTPEQVS